MVVTMKPHTTETSLLSRNSHKTSASQVSSPRSEITFGSSASGKNSSDLIRLVEGTLQAMNTESLPSLVETADTEKLAS